MRLLVAVVLIFDGNSFAQSELAKQVATKASCPRSNPQRVWRLGSAEGRRQKHTLTYSAGDYPAGVRFRSSINDKHVDKVKAKGRRVFVLDPSLHARGFGKGETILRRPAGGHNKMKFGVVAIAILLQPRANQLIGY